MINIYESINDENGNRVINRTKLFITETNEDGEILNRNYGFGVVPLTSGTMFIVDEWLIPQLDKVKMINGQLLLKDGEEIVPPVKTDLEIQEEELEKQLAALRAKKETNNIE